GSSAEHVAADVGQPKSGALDRDADRPRSGRSERRVIVASHPARGSLQQAIVADGFVFVRGAVMQRLIAELHPLSDKREFAASWNDLHLDTYMADGGRYRRRRFAVYVADAASIEREPHQPHYQTRDYNA